MAGDGPGDGGGTPGVGALPGDAAGDVPPALADGGPLGDGAVFDHVGIATDDTDAALALYRDALGMPVVHEEEFDGMRVTFCGDDAGVELLEPLPAEGGGDGAIAAYLEREGPGIHHLAVEVDDVAAALDALRDAGYDPIDDAPRDGAWGKRVAFVHPASTGGVLLELCAH
jgi:methylmalonyl-CoA/ethylmalonyl-CoA epimerase